VLGQVLAPLGASNFSSYLLQAQASGAQVLGLANAGGDATNAIKQANQFGVTKSMKLAGLLLFITDIHSVGLPAAQGLYLTTPWYWNQSAESRAWAGRFLKQTKVIPTFLQAGDYSATLSYLNAVKAAGTTDGAKVMAELHRMKVNDMFMHNGTMRASGLMIHDMYLMQVKTPAQSRKPWDYYTLVQTIPGNDAFGPEASYGCSL
jgi:branched-chain amino acid transport system substrate-binding protein